MILHFLIAICVFHMTALAAPQNPVISTTEPTITIYLPCPTDSTTLAPSSKINVSPYPTIAKAPSTISTDTIYTNANANANTYISASINSISQSSSETGIVDPASAMSNIAFSFMVVDGMTSWLNGQTPGDPTQSFAVVTSAVTVVPLSTPASPPTTLLVSSSEDVVFSTVVVIPLSTPPTPSPSSPNSSASSSEDVVLSTIVVVPLPIDSSHASSFTDSHEPVVVSTSMNTASSTSFSSPSSTGTTSNLSGLSEASAMYSKVSSSSSSSRSSISVSEPSSGFITSSILGSSLGADSSSTISASSSSRTFASSPTISKPASTKPTYQLTSSSEPEPSSTSELISSTGVSGMLFISLTTNVSSSSTPSSSSGIDKSNASVPFASIPTVSKLVLANSTSSLVYTSGPTLSTTSATRSSTGVSGISSGSITSSIFGSSETSSFSASGNFSSSVPSTSSLYSASSVPFTTSVPFNSSLYSASSTTISKSESANFTSPLASNVVTSQTTRSSGPVIITTKTTVELPLSTSTPASTPPITSSRASLGIATTTGKVHTFAPGGWNASLSSKSESSFNIYTSFTLGALTTLKAAGGFKDDQSATPVPVNLTTSTSSFSSQTAILSSTSSPDITSIPGTVSMSDATSIPSLTSSSNITSMLSMISMSDATSTSKSIQLVSATSISNSISLSNTTSLSSSITLSTASPISSVISVTIGSSSAHFSNSTSAVSTSTSTSSIVASPTPSDCGERGDFVLNFDDVPPLSVSNVSDTDVQPEPLFNPYHQFLFSDGFTVVPPPKRLPFLPSSSPLLLEFIPNFTANVSNRQTGPNAADHGFSGQIGSGDEGLTGCFNFNLHGASLGCDSVGPACDFTFTGYSYDVASKVTSQVAQQVVNVPACPELSNCSLTRIDLDSSFKDLTYFFMNVTVAGKPKLWWMDDVRLGWFDNTCTTGLCRQSAHLH
ncbi:hypothetical protein EYC80_007607 [Monilinia laxa]|uniref:DUF7371 domain-containing protein n=1 Tax=Monilinia laxa TaxID=61186 RepID=A0A5N6JWF5_MONLA|nr:hypothetical protein EYC80_007607 [Monilinia laxa]